MESYEHFQNELDYLKKRRKETISTVRRYSAIVSAGWMVVGAYGIILAENCLYEESVSMRTILIGAATVGIGALAHAVQRYTGKLQRESGGIEKKIEQIERDQLSSS